MIKVHFNDVELTRWITILNGFTAFNGADYDPTFQDYPTISGAEFVKTRKKLKKISVPFYVEYNSVADYDALQKALNVAEPKKLTFSHLPNRVFYAIPSGDLNFKEVRFNGKGTINFTVADGLGHALNTKRFNFAKNDQGVWEATIVNTGSEPVPINYKIKLKKESGFVAIASKLGVIQYGKFEETDYAREKKNITLASNQGGDFANWQNGTVFYENQGKKAVTTMSADTAFNGRVGLLPRGFNNTGNNPFFGAIKELNLSVGATEWYIWARAWFETGLMGQTGAWCLTVVDNSNRFIAGMAIEKHDRVGNRASVYFLLGDGKGGSHIKHKIDFTPSFWVADNPYGTEARNLNRNMFDLRKEGDKVTFFWYGQYFSYFESGIKNVEAAKVQFFCGQINGRNTNDQIVTHQYLNDFSFFKLNVPFWRDVPNRYPAGSELFIDASGEVNPDEPGRLYVNGLLAPDDEILGTQFFLAPPGETKVQLLVSSFSEVASAYAEIEEAWT